MPCFEIIRLKCSTEPQVMKPAFLPLAPKQRRDFSTIATFKEGSSLFSQYAVARPEIPAPTMTASYVFLSEALDLSNQNEVLITFSPNRNTSLAQCTGRAVLRTS